MWILPSANLHLFRAPSLQVPDCPPALQVFTTDGYFQQPEFLGSPPGLVGERRLAESPAATGARAA